MTATLPEPPIQLFVEVTNACNLHCAHCYVAAGDGRTQFLPPLLLHELIADFASIGGQSVTISGGEPTLHHGWLPALRLARHESLGAILLTNGTRIAEGTLATLLEIGAELAVSVDGGSAEVHDRIRGTGAFDATLRTLEAALLLGLGPQVTLCFTPMATNFADLPRVVALAQELGIGTVYVSLLENRGRAGERFASLGLSEAAKRSLVYAILSLQERYPEVAVQCLNLKCFTERLRGLELETEKLDRTIRVTAGGELFLTAYLDDEPFHLGTYDPGTLGALWFSDKTKQAFAGAAAIADECRSCFCWSACRGGSAAFGWIRNGRFGGVDSYCRPKYDLARSLTGGA